MSLNIKGLEIGKGRPKICVSIMGETIEEIKTQAEKAVASKAEIAEWRADFFRDIHSKESTHRALEEVRAVLGNMPMIFTIRTKQEGGNLQLSSDEYLKICSDVAESGIPDLIDVEIFMDSSKELIDTVHHYGIKVIASNHDFDKTPGKEKLIKILKNMDEKGADILKLAMMPKAPEDVLNLLYATVQINTFLREKSRSEEEIKPVITMSMGKLGAVSRISGETFGSAVTFGAMEKASAPGQLETEALYNILEIL